MEDSLNRRYVNISAKPFEHKVYNEVDDSPFSYKPQGGYWLSLESKDKNYYSEWDEEYRGTFPTDENGNVHATVVKFKPTTYVMSPAQDRNILEGFNNFVAGKDLSPDQKRKLFVELLRSRTGREDIENVICQIDLIEDVDVLEEIFGGFVFGNEYLDSVYENLAQNVRNGIRESFAGLEVTGYALGVSDDSFDDPVQYSQSLRTLDDPKYKETIDYFDMHSAVIFDTACLDVEKQIVYSQEEKEVEDDRDEK